MAGDRICIRCGAVILGRPVELRPPDPQMALCRPCNTLSRASLIGSSGVGS